MLFIATEPFIPSVILFSLILSHPFLASRPFPILPEKNSSLLQLCSATLNTINPSLKSIRSLIIFPACSEVLGCLCLHYCWKHTIKKAWFSSSLDLLFYSSLVSFCSSWQKLLQIVILPYTQSLPLLQSANGPDSSLEKKTKLCIRCVWSPYLLSHNLRGKNFSLSPNLNFLTASK